MFSGTLKVIQDQPQGRAAHLCPCGGTALGVTRARSPPEVQGQSVHVGWVCALWGGVVPPWLYSLSFALLGSKNHLKKRCLFYRFFICFFPL